MKFGIVANVKFTKAINIARDLLEFLKPQVELVLEQELGTKLEVDDVETAPIAKFDKLKIDILISIGGDGTILRALQQCNANIFGINAGVLGFLTEVREDQATEGLKRILDKDYVIDERTKLKTTLNKKRLFDAVNEAVIHTAHIAKMRHFEIFVDDFVAETIRADGIIIATPTGSTSYAMSAGGPILDPRVEAFIIVPIAPFKLSARPMVIPIDSTISIKHKEPKRPSLLVLDGQYEHKLEADDEITFTKSESMVKFIKFEPDFYKRIEEKLTI
ncbi:MAG: NAD(+)/NADH kinase [Thermoplasmata archaeon]|nr:NAD(+)/NADH kinase [Thermoplasmata archaeon]